MNSEQIREKFLSFFSKRGHVVIPSASLVTPDEKGVTNATLFNTAGMQPLVPYLLGKAHPAGKRLVDVQKCLRTIDLEDIGDKTHATFFEMLGNWSLGDYFKEEAINWSYEFLTSKSEGLGLDPKRLYVTVFEGNKDAPRDEEAAKIWQDIFSKNGISGQRIFYLPASMNWWEAGENGPCGPDTEMYYDVLNKFGGQSLTHEQFLEADSKREVVEVWNDVFMQYEKKEGKIIGKLPKPSVDTGAGLERLAMVLQGVDNIYETDLLKGVLGLTQKISGSLVQARIISDHLRSTTFLIGDGVLPSNTDRGYILRRLIRRAITNTLEKKIGTKEISEIVNYFVKIYGKVYPNLVEKSDYILKVINEESIKFAEALFNGSREMKKAIANSKLSKTLDPRVAFNLYTTHGLPLEIIESMAKEAGLGVDRMAFEADLKKHQDLSRVGAEQKFKGGLVDDSDPMVIRYHTATHLLHQALFDVLGENVGQKGSNITRDRLRFDFSWGAKMTDEQKQKVENIVNEKIAQALPMKQITLPRAEALKTGARHFFGEKYGEEISIYYVGQDLASAYSKEFCGGPHVKNTSELAGPEGKWKFKIQKEEAVAQGVRRIRAVLA